MELIDETKAIGVTTRPLWLDEALEDILDLRRSDVELFSKKVIFGQVLADTMENFPINLIFTPKDCGGRFGANFLNYPPSRELNKAASESANRPFHKGKEDIARASLTHGSSVMRLRGIHVSLDNLSSRSVCSARNCACSFSLPNFSANP